MDEFHINLKSENFGIEWLPKGIVGFWYQEGCRVDGGQEKHIFCIFPVFFFLFLEITTLTLKV